MTKGKCIIDDDPLAAEIAGWLRNSLTEPSVNAHIQEIDPGHTVYTPPQYSFHRMNCLGMAKLTRGRVEKRAIDQTAGDLERAALITNEEGLRIAKAAFFDRLKRNPADIQTKDLVSVISALSRGVPRTPESPTQDKISLAMSDLGDFDDADAGPGEDIQEPTI